MSRVFVCDKCEELAETMSYELMQVCEELDDDGEQIIQILHFCTTQCLCGFAMGLALDLSDNEGAT